MVEDKESKKVAREEFGRLLRKAREDRFGERSLTSSAKKLNVSPQFLSKVEEGKTAPLTPERIIKAAELYDVKPGPLLSAAGYGKIVFNTEGQPEEARQALLELATLPKISAGLARRLLEVVKTEGSPPAPGGFGESLVA